MALYITFDDDANALYVHLRDRHPADVARTVQLDDERNVDYAADGSVLGVEFLNARTGVRLDGVPERDRIAEALRAFPEPIGV